MMAGDADAIARGKETVHCATDEAAGEEATAPSHASHAPQSRDNPPR